MSPKARQAKSKARIKAYEKMAAEQFEDRPEELEIQIPPGKRLGDLVVEADEPRQGLRRPRDLRERQLPPAAGRHRRHHRPQRRRQDDAVPHAHGPGDSPTRASSRSATTVELGYVDQIRDDLDADKTVYEEISGGHDTLEMGGRKINSRAYVARFNFTGTDQQKKVGILSGGERNRVHLAKLLRRGSNVLLLDEPTNDLDVDTLRALEEAVAQLRRLRGRRQPRPLVPRPRGHAHPGVRRRRLRPLVRRQLPDLRRAAPRAPRRGG